MPERSKSTEYIHQPLSAVSSSGSTRWTPRPSVHPVPRRVRSRRRRPGRAEPWAVLSPTEAIHPRRSARGRRRERSIQDASSPTGAARLADRSFASRWSMKSSCRRCLLAILTGAAAAAAVGGQPVGRPQAAERRSDGPRGVRNMDRTGRRSRLWNAARWPSPLTGECAAEGPGRSRQQPDRCGSGARVQESTLRPCASPRPQPTIIVFFGTTQPSGRHGPGRNRSEQAGTGSRRRARRSAEEPVRAPPTTIISRISAQAVVRRLMFRRPATTYGGNKSRGPGQRACRLLDPGKDLASPDPVRPGGAGRHRQASDALPINSGDQAGPPIRPATARRLILACRRSEPVIFRVGGRPRFGRVGGPGLPKSWHGHRLLVMNRS